jgi:hypothetical protein
MKSKNILINFLNDISNQVEQLNETDIKKLESGGFDIAIKIVKKNKEKITKNILSDDKINELVIKLEDCNTRELGLEILNSYLKNKKELEIFAKRINVFILREDKVEKIKNNIVESTIGAKLRSFAIQGI